MRVLAAPPRSVYHTSLMPPRPRYEYQRVFSATAGGLLLFVSGLAGCDLSYSHGLFQGIRRADSPVWWQVGLGAALLLLAGFFARRVPPRAPGR